MCIYLMTSILVLSSGIIIFIKPMKYKKNIAKIVYLVFVGIVLIIIAGFRGDFNSDYVGYETIFNFHNQFNDLGSLLNYKYKTEIGYVIFNWLIGRFTDNAIWVFVLSSTIIIVLYFNEIRKHSSNICLSVLLFVTIGGYYISFNIMRQILSAAIVFAGSVYIYKGKKWSYFAVVLFASLFHLSALIMIPFYYILNFKFNYKKLAVTLILLFIVSNNIHSLIDFIQQYAYSHYLTGFYGMTGYGYKNIVLPTGVIIFTLIGYSSKLYEKNNKLNIWLNATIFYAFFSFLGLNIQMLERLSYFFAPYVLLIIPKILSNEHSKQLRIIYYFVVTVGTILYSYIVLHGSGYDPYYFIWSR